MSMKAGIGAYVPCFNNAATVRRALMSVRTQMPPPVETILIDDGSGDGSTGEVPEGVRVVRQTQNLGRGAARARAMRELPYEFVLCCDATNVLAPDFLTRALRHFEDERVAAVYGRIGQPVQTTAIGRWRGRHLFKAEVDFKLQHDAMLATYGAVVRASAVSQVGGYGARLRHSEDADLGGRLLTAGYQVIFDPSLAVTSLAPARMGATFERYWRWYAGADEATTWSGYARNIAYSVRGMAAADLRARDVASVPLSLLAPHYQFWRSRWRRRAGSRGVS